MQALQRARIRRTTSGATTVADVMTPDVASVSPETPLHEAAGLLLAQRFAALPVVDPDDGVVGVLSERDLLGRLIPRQARPWWHLLVDTEQLAREYRKATGTTVREVMTYPAAIVSPDAPLATVVRLLDAPEVELVPVVHGSRLVGSVGRRDLVDSFSTVATSQIGREDAELDSEMRARMEREAWISTPRPTVETSHGVLRLWWLVGGEAEKAALVTMARSIPGCKAVDNHLIVKGAVSRYHEVI